MNRRAVEAELPPGIARWLDDLEASTGTWKSIAGDIAMRVGRRIRVSGDAGAWNTTIYTRLAADVSAEGVACCEYCCEFRTTPRRIRPPCHNTDAQNTALNATRCRNSAP